MKRIVCLLCDGTEFVKEGDYFICQGCGTKYSLEEAKGMMKEVPDASPAEGGQAAPASTAPVAPETNANQQQIDNLLLLANNAFTAGNNEEAEKYCNRVIELDATCYQAWFLKGKSMGWSSTIKNPRIQEAGHSFKQALDFAPEGEKEQIAADGAAELERLGLASIALRQKRFADYPDEQELNGFVNDIDMYINGLIVLLSKNEAADTDEKVSSVLGALGNVATIKIITLTSKGQSAGVPDEFFTKIATMMGNAAVDGFKTTKSRYAGISHPVQNDWKRAVRETNNCISLLDVANSAAGNLDASNITRLRNTITILEYQLDLKAYSDFGASYRNYGMSEVSKKNIKTQISKTNEKIRELDKKITEKAAEEKKKAEEESRARAEAYWAAHPEERAALDAELAEARAKKDAVSAELKEVDAEIRKLDPKGKVPSEEEESDLYGRKLDLERQRSHLGIFSGKEKKRITEEIASIETKRAALKTKIEEEKKARKAEADEKMAPLKEKKEELRAELNDVLNKIGELERRQQG